MQAPPITGTGRTNQQWIDNIRTVATCSVILLHVAAPFLYQFQQLPLQAWWFANLYDSAVRASVPLFVMLTGALLLGHEQALPSYLRKRLVRILIPFIFWSLIYLGWEYFITVESSGVMSVFGTVKWAYKLLQSGTQYHLWYMYMIIGLYLFIPLLGKWIRASTNAEIIYFLGIWTITLFANLPVFAQFGIHIDLQNFMGYAGYAVLGYFIARTKRHKTGIICAVGTTIIGFLITAFATYSVTKSNNQFVGIYYNYLTPNTLLMAAGIFYLFRHFTFEQENNYLAWFKKMICSNSFNIYLAHVLLLALFKRRGLDAVSLPIALKIPLLSAACLASTVVLTQLIKKTFLGRYISG